MGKENLESEELGEPTKPSIISKSGENFDGQLQISRLKAEEEQRQQQEDEKGLGTVRAEIANSGDQSESLAKPLLPRYIDRAGIPTREMREREEDKQDQEYVRNKGIFPTGRVDLISRAISLLRRVKYKGLKGEGAKKDFDHVELGKKIEMLSRGYHLSYQVDAVPDDVSKKLSELFEKAKKAPGFEKKFDFDMATARLLEEFEIESPDEQHQLKLSECTQGSQMILFPDSKASRTLGKTFALAGLKIVVVTGDLRDPDFLVSLAHELGHQRKNAEIGNRSALYDPSLANNHEAAKILKSERDASAFALSILRPFIDSGSNKRLLNRTQTIKNLESCIASYSNRLFWMQAANRYLPKSEDKPQEQKTNIREKYYLSIPELTQWADGFINLVSSSPKEATDELEYFCRLIIGEIDDIVQDQADVLKINVQNVSTNEGKLRTFCFKILDELKTNSSQIDQQGYVDRGNKIKEMIGRLEGDDDVARL